MSESPPDTGVISKEHAALVFLISGAIAFVCIMLSEDGRSIFPYMAMLIRNPERFDVQDAMVFSSFFTLGAVALTSPFLIKWLPTSLLMRTMLRVFSGLPATIFLYFCLRYGVSDEPILALLVISPLLTFIGLLLIKPAIPPKSIP